MRCILRVSPRADVRVARPRARRIVAVRFARVLHARSPADGRNPRCTFQDLPKDMTFFVTDAPRKLAQQGCPFSDVAGGWMPRGMTHTAEQFERCGSVQSSSFTWFLRRLRKTKRCPLSGS